MPRWNIHLIEGTLSREEKDRLAAGITALYVKLGIPGFTVNVFFEEHGTGGFYSGGRTPAKAVFIAITHAARGFVDDAESRGFHTDIDALVRPILGPKALKWEYNIYEFPNTHWRINGLVPPVSDQKLWRQWIETDGPVPY